MAGDFGVAQPARTATARVNFLGTAAWEYDKIFKGESKLERTTNEDAVTRNTQIVQVAIFSVCTYSSIANSRPHRAMQTTTLNVWI